MSNPGRTSSSDVISHTEDEKLKNPIRTRLRMYAGPVPAELLVPVVTRGRDFFHLFIAATLKRKYRRVVPIHLVDDWVVDALGVFMERGRRVLPGWQVDELLPQDDRPRPPPIPSLRMSAEVVGLEPLLALFERLKVLRDLVSGARLLRIAEPMGELTDLCHQVAGRRADLARLEEVAQQLAELVRRAGSTLDRDLFMRPHIDHHFAQELIRAIGEVVRAAQKANAAPEPAVPGTGFGRGRSSGLLFGSIPALQIEGPAILLAPNAITQWANGFKGLHEITEHIGADGMETWFGVVDREHRAAAVGLANVVQHELTHAMVALPNDPVEDVDQLFRRRWSLYEQQPSFEEGLCDATAAVATGVALLKAQFGINGRDLPRLHVGRYEKNWDRIFPAIRATYAAYHGAATDTWLQAWENNNRDFGAFSGAAKLYATNFSGNDWNRTFDEFRAGRISTGGNRVHPAAPSNQAPW